MRRSTRRNYRCKFVDYSDLLDELIVLNRQEDLNKYRKRIKRCNYSYICNTISTYHKEPLQSTMPQSSPNEDAATAVSGAYKDDDSKYSLKNLLKRQETEAGNEE